MIKKIIFLITLVILSSCKGPEKISEEEVLTAFDNFFDVLDNDLDNFSSVVTDDFFIYENSRRYTKEEFIDFVKTFDIVSSKRSFENIEVDSDVNSAHISLTQFGEFIVNTPSGKVKLSY